MELNEPLGVRPQPKPRRRVVSIAIVAAAVAALGAMGFLVLTADPHGGEPSATAIIPPPAGRFDLAAPDTMSTGSLGAGQMAGATGIDAAEGDSGVKIVRGNHGGPVEPHPTNAAGPLVIDVTRALDDPQRQREAALGGTPVVTGPQTHAPAANTPRVAIFVSGMGLNDIATRTAIDTMPAAVDLAFVPYAATTQDLIDAAKAKGHEILLQLPMQTADGSTPGPHALRPDESKAEVAADLGWLMDRAHGYAGVTNLLGAPVSANATTMNALLQSVAAHGAFYLDDGTSPRSLAMSLAPALGVTSLRADVVIDATGDPNIVSANLSRLASLARQNGHAIGMASGLPDHMSTIAHFAADLGGQGINLVPVSALAGRDPSIATAR